MPDFSNINSLATFDCLTSIADFAHRLGSAAFIRKPDFRALALDKAGEGFTMGMMVFDQFLL